MHDYLFFNMQMPYIFIYFCIFVSEVAHNNNYANGNMDSPDYHLRTCGLLCVGGGGEGNGLTVSEEIAAKEKEIGVDNTTPISYYLTL